MPVELVTATSSAENVLNGGEKRAAVVGPNSDACEQVTLLLEVLGWTPERAASIADVASPTLRLLFIDGRPGAVPVEPATLNERNSTEMVVVYGASSQLALSLRNINKVINFLDLPIDLALAEDLIEQAS